MTSKGFLQVRTLLRTTTGAVSEDGRPQYSASPSSFVFLGIASGESPPTLKSVVTIGSCCGLGFLTLRRGGFREPKGHQYPPLLGAIGLPVQPSLNSAGYRHFGQAVDFAQLQGGL